MASENEAGGTSAQGGTGAGAVPSRDLENLAIVIATRLINAEEREAMDAPASGANFYDEAKIILRGILGNRDPSSLWDERRDECGAIRQGGMMTGTRWQEYYEDDNWHGSRTDDVRKHEQFLATIGQTNDLTPTAATK